MTEGTTQPLRPPRSWLAREPGVKGQSRLRWSGLLHLKHFGCSGGFDGPAFLESLGALPMIVVFPRMDG